MAMKNILNQIIELDREEQKAIKEANERRRQTIQSIGDIKTQLTAEYMKIAKEKSAENEKAEDELLTQKLSGLEIQMEEEKKRLTELSEKHSKAWVDEIVAAVLQATVE